MNSPCEYCQADLPEGVDNHTRRIRSIHFAIHAKERAEAERLTQQQKEDERNAQLEHDIRSLNCNVGALDRSEVIDILLALLERIKELEEKTA